MAICTSLFWENCQKKFGTAIFGHSKFVPEFFDKNVFFRQFFFKEFFIAFKTITLKHLTHHRQMVSVFLSVIAQSHLSIKLPTIGLKAFAVNSENPSDLNSLGSNMLDSNGII